MKSRQIGPLMAAAILAIVLVGLGGGGYYLFLRPKDDGLGSGKMTPHQRLEFSKASGKLMGEYLRSRNGGGGLSSQPAR